MNEYKLCWIKRQNVVHVRVDESGQVSDNKTNDDKITSDDKKRPST